MKPPRMRRQPSEQPGKKHRWPEHHDQGKSFTQSIPLMASLTTRLDSLVLEHAKQALASGSLPVVSSSTLLVHLTQIYAR